jgi:FkbM family methyltransferase
MNNIKIIYDLGANNGDDIPYYLIKADRVVAVEANPVLADEIKTQFNDEIEQGRLIVETCAVTVDAGAESVPFYVSIPNHVQSTFVRPRNADDVDCWNIIQVPSCNVVELIQRHGDPYYVKIDIEHYDQHILKALFDADIRPPYISSEAHIVDIFCILAGHGNYNRFKIVLGRHVPRDYGNKEVVALDGSSYMLNCPHHSAGPFGEDVNGPWLSTQDFFNEIKDKNITFGWIDIHATTHQD